MSEYIYDNLIIIDAPTSNGKTSLCWHLVDKYRFNYFHTFLQHQPRLEYNQEFLDFAINNITKYHHNFVIERMHLSELAEAEYLNRETLFDCEKFDADLRKRCQDNNIKYKLITCLGSEEVILKNTSGWDLDMYKAFKKVYLNYKDTFNIYNYNFVEDGDYTEIDKFIEGE